MCENSSRVLSWKRTLVHNPPTHLPRVELAHPSAEVRRDVVAQVCSLGHIHSVVDAVDVFDKVLIRSPSKTKAAEKGRVVLYNTCQKGGAAGEGEGETTKVFERESGGGGGMQMGKNKT